MDFHLDSLLVRLETNNKFITDSWATFLEGWPYREPQINPDLFGNLSPITYPADIQVRLTLVDTLASPPAGRPLFSECNDSVSGEQHTLDVFLEDKGYHLYYPTGASIHIPIADGFENSQPIIHGTITPWILDTGWLNDVIFSALAGILRRKGYFLIHAFTSIYKDQALLIVGPSGSGKTTTGLNLLRRGWGFLSDDIAMVKEMPTGIDALPMPGGFSISRKTGEMLSGFKKTFPKVGGSSSHEKMTISVPNLTKGWASPAKVSAICFPRINLMPESVLTPLSKAETLARLIEASIDRWDESIFYQHLGLLENLCYQARGFDLELGQDLDQLSELLGELGQEKL